MHTLKHGLVFAALLLGARLLPAAAAPAFQLPPIEVNAPANTPTPPTVVPALGLWLIPAGHVFKSWADYRHSVEVDFTGSGGTDRYHGFQIISAETLIRRADTGRPVARIPYQGPLTGKPGDQRPVQGEWTGDAKTYNALRTALPDDQAKALDQNPPGEFLLAVYVNGVRASNVAKIRIDPAFDAATAPTLQLGGIEPNPRAPLGFVVLWAIGPTPADPELTDFRLRYCSFVLDGVARHLLDGPYSGPSPKPLTSGQRFAVSLHDGVGDAAFVPAYDSSQPHTYAMSFTPAEREEPSVRFGGPDTPSGMRHLYTAAPLSFDPKAHPLGDAWDQSSPPDETRPVILPAFLPAASAPVPSVNVAAPDVGADSADLNSLVQSGASLSDAAAAYAQFTHQTLSLPEPLPAGNLFFSPRPHFSDQAGSTKAQVAHALRVLLALNDVMLKDSPDGTQVVATVDLAAATSYSKLAGSAIEDRLKPLLADLRTNLVTVNAPNVTVANVAAWLSRNLDCYVLLAPGLPDAQINLHMDTVPLADVVAEFDRQLWANGLAVQCVDATDHIVVVVHRP